jgi:hypothetical protein
MTKLTALALSLAVAACGGAMSTPADPGQQFETERVHQGGQVKLRIPAGWNVDDSGNSLVVTAPDQTVSLQVTLLDAKDLGTALLQVAGAALIGYDNLQLVGSPVDANIHGMAALFQDGRGTYRGVPVELSVGVIDTPTDKFLLVVGEAESATYREHEGAIHRFIEGIKPM